MPPTGDVRDLRSIISEHVSSNKVVIFSKTTCPYCRKVKDLFNSLNIEYKSIELDRLNNGGEMQTSLTSIYGQKTVPLIIISGQHIGGCDDTMKMHSEGRLMPRVMGEVGMAEEVAEGDYDYDLVVIGGGSGGLSCAKEASSLGRKVACLDFVKPTPQGTTWGLGGTCVNVGCIPKKLMHQAGLLGHHIKDAQAFGWDVPDAVNHDWITMRNSIQSYIKSLNWGYKAQLRSKKVTYENAYGQFVGPHKIKCINKKRKEKELTSRYFVVATGGRPKLPDIPGCKEYCVSSDDLFSLPYCPGKTLSIGASYVSLECAGFLKSLGMEVVVMVRSILLRGFDQQMAEMVGGYMAKEKGVRFVRPCVPTKIEKLRDGQPGLYRVSGVMQDTMEAWSEEFNTVLVAVGRDPCTADLNLTSVGVKVNQRSGYILCDNKELTSCPHIYAIGDIVEGRPELTPVAIKAGKLLARRLFAGEHQLCDYNTIPTTVFTPLEYGCIGLTEEDARTKFGTSDIKVYHSNFTPLEWQVPHHAPNACYAKLICVNSLNERVVGFHVLGPNAGEITQGWTVGMKLKATKHDFDNSIGIHPTCAEVFTTLSVTKGSGVSAQAEGC